MTPLHNSSDNGTASSESMMCSTGEDSVTWRSRAFVGTSAFQRAKKAPRVKEGLCVTSDFCAHARCNLPAAQARKART